jgi:hypothetical protein
MFTFCSHKDGASVRILGPIQNIRATEGFVEFQIDTGLAVGLYWLVSLGIVDGVLAILLSTNHVSRHGHTRVPPC